MPIELFLVRTAEPVARDRPFAIHPWENQDWIVRFLWGATMRAGLRQIAVVAALAGAWTTQPLLFAAEQTWTGKVSDSRCGASHQMMASMANLSDEQCTRECVKAQGKYVFVGPNDKVFAIANQDFAGLALHPNQTVQLTGELKGDSITVSKIEPAKPSK